MWVEGITETENGKGGGSGTKRGAELRKQKNEEQKLGRQSKRGGRGGTEKKSKQGRGAGRVDGSGR